MGKDIKKVAVIGTGTLGTQIALLAACNNYGVSVWDMDEGSFKSGMQKLKTITKTAGKKSAFFNKDVDEAVNAITFCEEMKEALQDADLIIEAVPENLDLKRETFKKFNTLAPLGAILASNSSSIPISKIEDVTTRPEQCLNTHFYYPAIGHNMVDVMGGTKTTPKVIETVKEWVRSLGLVPLTVKKEILGFCFNRVWRAIKREALYMWAEGFVDFRDIDRGWMIFTGMDYGPFGLMDNVGLDVIYDIEMVYYNESKDPKDHPPESLKAMVDRGELGIKTKKGFYAYPNPEYSRPDFIRS